MSGIPVSGIPVSGIPVSGIPVSGAPYRVVKVGGSLFELTDLSDRLANWLARQPPAANLFIAGGGELADAMRRLDCVQRLGDERSHWLCIQLLDVTSQVLAGLLPHVELVRRWDDLPARLTAPSSIVVFSAEQFLRKHEADLPGRPLDHSWQTTTDSIAARIGSCLGASELVLLKSRDLPRDLDWQAAAAHGFVDGAFALTSTGLAVRWVNLRG